MKHVTLFSLLVACILVFAWGSSSEAISRDLSEGILRLHILANSNTEEDQNLKLKVRDRLLKEAKKSPKLLSDRDIETICLDEIDKNGFNYPVSITRGKFYFPHKTYQNIALPAGNYNAVRITIGSGEGQNWWCVMYPPLCFTQSCAGMAEHDALTTLEKILAPESLALITQSEAITIKPSFKLVELWNELKKRMQN